MNDVSVHSIATPLTPAAPADRAFSAWSWYYVDFIEARLADWKVVYR